MKKTIAVLLALILSLSVLVACGGEEDPEPAILDRTAEPPEPAATAEPEPTPAAAADGMNLVEITDAEYGDIIFSYPDDGSVTVTIAEPGADDQSLMPRDVFEDLIGVIIEDINDIDYQRALIAGDDFNILIGYTNYFNTEYGYKTFGMVEYYRTDYGAEHLSLGGITGYANVRSVVTIGFPAITQFAGRVILIFPNSVDEDDDLNEINQELFKRADIQAILKTFEFPGEMLNEPRLEVQPLDDEFFSITPTDGWEFTYMDFDSNSYELVKGDMEVSIDVFEWWSVSYQINEYLSSAVYDDIEQLDNATFNGQEFVVLRDDWWDMTILITSLGGGPLDTDSDGHLLIDIRGTDSLNDVASLLNTITVN